MHACEVISFINPSFEIKKLKFNSCIKLFMNSISNKLKYSTFSYCCKNTSGFTDIHENENNENQVVELFLNIICHR